MLGAKCEQKGNLKCICFYPVKTSDLDLPCRLDQNSKQQLLLQSSGLGITLIPLTKAGTTGKHNYPKFNLSKILKVALLTRVSEAEG